MHKLCVASWIYTGLEIDSDCQAHRFIAHLLSDGRCCNREQERGKSSKAIA